MNILSQEFDSDSIFCASISNVKNIYHILKAVQFKETATIFATENGLKITVEDSKCIQGNAFIQDQVFQEYILRENSIAFKINVDILQECLSMFSNTSKGSTALKMSHNGYGTPLVLILEEDGIVMESSIKTQEADVILDFGFSSTNVINKVLLIADCLKQAFNDLDTTSDYLQIIISPDKPFFRLSTSGEVGQCHHDVQKDSDMVEYFECNRRQESFYKWNLLRPIVKAINLASKVSIRVDFRGFLALQCMVKNENNQTCFVEYYCCPCNPDDDDRSNDEYTFK